MKATLNYCVFLSLLTMGSVESGRSADSDASHANRSLQEIHDLIAEQTRLRIYHSKSHPRNAEIERRIQAIHRDTLKEFEVVARDAALDCSEEPKFGQLSYGIILYATTDKAIVRDELLLFHGSYVYRTRGWFQPLKTSGEGWFFRPSTNIPAGSNIVVACLHDAPEEIQNVENGFMPNSNRARNPQRPYRTKIYHRSGKLFQPTH